MRNVVPVILMVFLFLCIQPLYGQKAILEYFQGREIVIYTPDYKLILLEELEPGDEIPIGSIIETGRKSVCELRISPGGTIMKVGDRTTFKIEELKRPDQDGRNKFKLIDGSIRAVTGARAFTEEYIFLTSSSEIYPGKADFGITVKKGWEEKVFVLSGEVRYVNACSEEITLYSEQMANGLDDTLKAEPLSVRMKRLANSLAFTFLKPSEVDSGRETTPVQTPLPTSTPGATDIQVPIFTAVPTNPSVNDMTPGPVITPEPTAYREPTTGPGETEAPGATREEETSAADTNSTGDSEKSTKAFVYDPSRGELYPAEDYAFTAKYSYANTFRVDEIRDGYIIVSYALPEPAEGEEGSAPAEPPPLPEYSLLEIYDVFAEQQTLKGKEVYSGFIDSVVLLKVKDRVFYFSFLWEGAAKNIKSGYYLYPTGRFFSVEEEPVIVLPEEESGENNEGETGDEAMQFSGGNGPGRNNSGIGVNIDMGFDITVGFFDVDTGSGDFDFFLQLLMLLYSTRGHYFADVTLKFTDWFGLGAEAGFAMMYWEENYFLDFPLRGYLRFGSKDLYIQPFCGYYFSFALPSGGEFGSAYIDGLDVGAAVSLFGFYLEGSYVFGELVGHTNYFKAGLGVVINDMFGTGR